MISREAILEAYPLEDFIRKQGREVKHSGISGESVCQCFFHSPDNHPSMRINNNKQVFYCDVCHIGGSVIDLVVRLQGLSVKNAMQKLAQDAGLVDPTTNKQAVTATYQYKDAFGRPVMLVDRIENGSKKRFRQYHKDANGNAVNGIEGIQRVLYRMEEWAGSDEVALCEGERCVHALEEIGFSATTNPGGSSGWIPAYSSYLKNKHVDIWPDNDEPGEKWLGDILASLEGKVESLRILRVPDIYGDVADLITSQGLEIGAKTILDIVKKTPRISKGVMIELLSADECWDMYKKRVALIDEEGIDFGKWLPSFRKHTRPLLPGDMAVILADTAAGKTTILNNIAMSQRPINCIFFQLELSAEAMTERFIANDYQIETLEIERSVKQGKDFSLSGWKHIFVCPKSNVTIEEMENIINKSELKIGKRPACVFVDYIGLMGGGHGKRYERLSTIAESLKIMARTTNTVVIIASQIRRDPNREEVDLHSGRDSSSIESSAQLVIGAWRKKENEMILRILKNTKRAGQPKIECLFNGNTQTIVELAPDNYTEGG